MLAKFIRKDLNFVRLTFEVNGVETIEEVRITNEKELHNAIKNADRNTLVEVEIWCTGITRIESVTFQALPQLRIIYLPSSLRNIDPYAFFNCHNLQEVDFGSAVKTIEVREGIFLKYTLDRPFNGLVELLKKGLPATINPDNSWSRWD